MQLKPLYIVVLVTMFFSVSAISQSKKQQALETKRQRLLEEVRQLNALYSLDKKKESSVVKQVEDVTIKIRIRQNLIKITNEQANQLTREINRNQNQISDLRTQLKELRDDYAKMVVKSYKSKSEQSKVMFLLSSESFKQAYKRLQYINQYKSYQKKQAEDIKLKSKQLQKLNLSLAAQKTEKNKLIAENRKAKKALEQEIKAQEELMALVQKDLKKHAAEIKHKQRETSRIDREINALIVASIKVSNKKAGKKTSTGKFVLLPKEKLLGESFEANKGKLGWPVDRGVIKTRYGLQRSMIDKTITQNYQGIRILTTTNAKVKAVFKGKIHRIMIIPNSNPVVIIKHGNYLTAYRNMSKITVKPGEEVKAGQIIGEAFTNKITGQTLLGFNVYKNDKHKNPEYWLTKK